MSKLLQIFKEAGLLGCLDGTGVTSENYKEFLYNHCTERGCRNLDTRCLDCGRTIVERIVPPSQEWINIDEQSPPCDEYILVYLGDLDWNKRIHVGKAKCYGNMAEIQGEYYEHEKYLARFTHWMPLPNPPEEGK